MSYEANVLVLDEDLATRGLVAQELTKSGHRVVEVGDGATALAALEHREFDLIISGLRMAGMGGVTVLEMAKQLSPRTEVIVMTAHAEVDAVIECLRRGAFDLLRKPLELEELTTCVHRALEHRRDRVMASLHRACHEIVAGVSELPLYVRIADGARELLEADDVSVMLLDGAGALRIAHAPGLAEELLAGERVPLGERISGRVALEKEPVVVTGPSTADPRFEDVEAAGRAASSIVHPLLHGDQVLGVLSLSRRDGRRRFRDVDLEPVGIFADQAALALHNERLTERLVGSERLAAIGQLAAGIVHEINNPLGYLAANVEFARATLEGRARDAAGLPVADAESEEALASSLEDITTGVTRLREIIADMRSLSPTAEEEIETFAVADALRSAERLAEPIIRGVAQLEHALQPGLEVAGRRGLLGQVFLNLLVNAAQALESEGRRDGYIGVRSWVEDALVHVEVADDGPGLSPEAVARVMEPFFTTKQGKGGSGLGLPISRDIVERHGGRLRVSSTPGRGAIFTVSLPLAVSESADAKSCAAPEATIVAISRAGESPTREAPAFALAPSDPTAQEPLEVEVEISDGGAQGSPLPGATIVYFPKRGVERSGARRAAGGEAASPEARATPRRPRLLLVDDEPTLLRAYQRSFRSTFEVCLAADGQAAIELLEADPDFDVIVSDVSMPRVSGPQLLQEVHARWPSLAQRVILLSGLVVNEDDRRLLKELHARILDKPVDLATLRREVEGAAGLYDAA